ncbi:zinc ribbon domain-containing protein [Desulfovibrio sp. OttesenSCG-928-A18]|nr:zinc ribbon domain-containing protein [Desulfovibrio sp. OttesenSCG-928-A18]
MPIYEYKCTKCEKEFEELVFGDENPPCPACGAGETTRLLSCACLHMPAPSRAGQTVSYPSAGGKSACGGCTATSCAGCK